MADQQQASITSRRHGCQARADRPSGDEGGASDFLGEVQAVFQPLTPDPLSRDDAAEIADNLSRFGAIIQRWAVRRAVRRGDLDADAILTPASGGLGGPS